MTTVWSVTTIKASPEETVRFVSYHLNLGVDHMVLFFDDPQDASISLVEKHPQVTCIRCDAQHWSGVDEAKRNSVIRRQGQNGMRALKMAREQGADWLLHMDTDELIYAKNGLKVVFEAAPPEKDTIVFRSREAVPEKIERGLPFVSSRFFRALPRRRKDWQRRFEIAARLGCEKYFLDGRYFRGHQVGKAAVRTASDA